MFRETEDIKVIKACQVYLDYLDNLVVMEFLDHLETEDRR